MRYRNTALCIALGIAVMAVIAGGCDDSRVATGRGSAPEAPPDIANPADGGTPEANGDAGNADADAGTAPTTSPVPAAGGADTLDVGSWNIEWFGSPDEGPADEALQTARVRDTVLGARVDVWGFEEVVDGERFRAAIQSVPGYQAIVGSDAIVEGGAASYGPDEQKVAFAYNAQLVRVRSAQVILRESSFDFAGRPPLAIEASYETPDGRTVPVTFIVVHLKAGNDSSAWNRRQASIAALKSLLDSRAEAEAIFVVGDWNDELGRSKVKGNDSPFASLVRDSARYAFPTLSFGERGISTMVTSRFANDQHVITIAAAVAYVAGSATVLRLDNVFAAYGDTTSDHFPVVSRYRP